MNVGHEARINTPQSINIDYIETITPDLAPFEQVGSLGVVH